MFFPEFLLEGGRAVVVEGLREGGRWRYDRTRQTLFVVPAQREGAHCVTIRVQPPLAPLFAMPTHWAYFWMRYAGAAALVLAVLAMFVVRRG